MSPEAPSPAPEDQQHDIYPANIAHAREAYQGQIDRSKDTTPVRQMQEFIMDRLGIAPDKIEAILNS